MCGRYFENSPRDEIAAAFRIDPAEADLAASYNVAPGHEVAVVRFDPKRDARFIQEAHWGLIPHFAKDRKSAFKHINARAETVAETPSFRTGFAKRRCLVIASGFYEWRKVGKRKQPYAIALRDRAPIGLAGVVEYWRDPKTGEWVRSCAVITTRSNELVAQLHDRMPVIIAPQDYARWLGEEPVGPEELKALLRPYASEEMVIWPVDARMNKPEFDDPALLDPVQESHLELDLS